MEETIISIKVEYPIGSIVYFKTDENNTPGLVIGFYVDNESVSYRVSFSGEIHTCYGIELRDYKDFKF